MAMDAYRVNIGGVQHTIRYSEQDAKRLKLTAADKVKAPAPSGKAAAAPANK